MTGKGKNYMYSHLHPATKMYEPHPKPVGIAFGGNIGNERIFIDEDFAKLTIRHHAIDKTYQHGPLAPNQVKQSCNILVYDIDENVGKQTDRQILCHLKSWYCYHIFI